MKQLLFILTLGIMTSCGGEYVHKAELPEDDIETYNYVILKLDFIQEIRNICEDLHNINDFENEAAYNQEVAQCTIDNLSILDLDAIEQFDDEICNNPETEEEQQICDAIN